MLRRPVEPAVISGQTVAGQNPEIADEGSKSLLNSGPDLVLAQKVMDLRDMFRNAYTGWLEVEEAA